MRCRKKHINSNSIIPTTTTSGYPGQYQCDVDNIKKDLEMIKTNLADIKNNFIQQSKVNVTSSDHNSSGCSNLKLNVKSYADVTRAQQTSNIVAPGSELRASVLETFHSELNAIKKRASDVVVSGLVPRTDISDDCLFQDLCATHLSVHPTNVTVKRLGEIKQGRVQPLLVQLSNPGDASSLLSLAKQLRSSSDPYVRDHVYLNKHMTRAEAASAYQSRVLQRRSRLSDKPASNVVASTDKLDNASQSTSSSGANMDYSDPASSSKDDKHSGLGSE